MSHLDKTDVYNAPQDQEEKEKREQGDDYVLSRLFKKSGVHSALKHDVIMDGDGGADFALIDAEAERVAKEAVQRVRDSQKACFRARDGIPTFTGNIKDFESYHFYVKVVYNKGPFVNYVNIFGVLIWSAKCLD